MPDLRSFAIPALGAVVLSALLSACGGDGDSGGTTRFVKSVMMTGAQENPAVTTAATGSGTLTFNGENLGVSGSVTTFGVVNATAAHIHIAEPGVNGPIIIALTQGPTGTWTVPTGAAVSADQWDAMRAGNLYVNVHTAANPSGETRGQVGRQLFYATLTGAQEVPPVTTGASGTGRFVYDPETRTLSGTVSTTGIDGTAAHLHTGAVGVPGPVTIPLAGGPTWSLAPTVLTAEQAAALAGGTLFANVHSAASPGGEIRGQLFTAAKRATLTGEQETPPVTTSASGTGWLMVNPFTKAVAGRIETTGIAGVAAHVHRAPAGTPGGVVIPLTSPSPGVWVTAPGATIGDDLLAAFMKGELYFNVHTVENPAGEIRGQLVEGQ